MKEVIGYYCKNCGQEKGRHLAKTFNCQVRGGTRRFPLFSKVSFYEENLNKPIYGVIL